MKYTEAKRKCTICKEKKLKSSFPKSDVAYVTGVSTICAGCTDDNARKVSKKQAVAAVRMFEIRKAKRLKEVKSKLVLLTVQYNDIKNMTMFDLTEEEQKKLFDRLDEHYGADDIDITSDLVNDVGLDSMEKTEFFMWVENTYNIPNINDTDSENIYTIKDLFNHIDDQITKRDRHGKA